MGSASRLFGSLLFWRALFRGPGFFGRFLLRRQERRIVRRAIRGRLF